MTRTGQRNAWVQAFASTETTGDAGDPQPSWSDTPALEFWARKRNLTQREVVVAGALQQEDAVVFETLYMDALTVRHRLKYSGRYYDITGISDPGERHETLHIYARDAVSYGS